MKCESSFEKAWQRYVNGLSNHPLENSEQRRLLLECLSVATSTSEAYRVFLAVLHPEVGSVRSKALKTMIELAKTQDEAELAYKTASKRRGPRFPACIPAAKAKLDSFSKAA